MNDLRDWCISRQLWWGHRIPVFYCDACGVKIASEKDDEICVKCGAKMRQDEDVLDTWFSSGLWAFSTLGWGNLSCGNSSLDKHSADLGFFGVSQTQSLVSTPKIPKSNESHTENPSVVDSASAESNEMQNFQSNNRSNGGVALRCFDAERAKIGLGRPLSEVSYQNNANEYPRTNCTQDESATINIGIIGRVNVGKSSILNALLNKNRSLVSEVEGTTIDPVSDEIAYKGKILRFVDTAGIRRASKIEGIEKFALIRTKNILEQSNIVLLVLDSSQDFVELDEKISGLSQKYNLGIIILLNKWDIKCADFKAIETQIRRKFAYLAYAPILTISALKMRHIDEIKEMILRVWENFNRRIATAELNSHLKIATQKHPIPSDKGKIIKVYYATQVDCAPPTIMLSMNRPRALHFSYKRYLVNYFRANFDFSGVPIVILTKGREKGGVAK